MERHRPREKRSGGEYQWTKYKPDAKICEHCGAKTIVTNTRPHKDHVRRQQICPKCQRTWTTVEIRLDRWQELLRKEEELENLKGILADAARGRREK